MRLTFNIRFAADGNVPDLCDIWVGDRESVREFKRRVSYTNTPLFSRFQSVIPRGSGSTSPLISQEVHEC